MKKKTISVIALDPRAGASYYRNIHSLFHEYADIASYSVLDGTATGVLEKADLFVISFDAYGSAEEVALHVPVECPTMDIEVSFRWRELQLLKEIPKGTKVLFVNMTLGMAREAISQLAQLGINHLQFIPFYPGATLTEPVDLAVTPDEERYIPEQIKRRINLGHRSCTSGMMIEIALRLGLEQLLETEPFQQYLQSIATSNYSFDQMFARSTRLESQFHILMDILNDGVIGITEKGTIFACSHHAEEITRTSSSLVIGKNGDLIYPYMGFSRCLKEKEALPAKVIKINGINVSIMTVPVMRQHECIGAFAILQKFNDVEIRQNELRGQLLKSGHCAKYGFGDIIGASEAICRTKNLLTRMATSESPILLIGDTGTGKELFAHAVHRASNRCDGPFIAINVAAVPENLLESELFGYEEGAFTGAKKGGRPGLFEFSHKGTLFLDEVEGMSMMSQIKLLRVLQEREIMRVGGNQIINIDVRIVAATNESLEEKVADGSFRRDLYYRLNTLPVVIPTLREREGDIFLLIAHMKHELKGNFKLSETVKSFLQQYSWPGNIRELQNVVEYFVFTGHPVIGIEDLPPTIMKNLPLMRRKVLVPPVLSAAAGSQTAATAEGDFWFILGQLYLASDQQFPMGRERLLLAARNAYRPLSQKEVRALLKNMAERGLAKVSKGRGGSQITAAGRMLWETHSKDDQFDDF